MSYLIFSFLILFSPFFSSEYEQRPIKRLSLEGQFDLKDEDLPELINPITHLNLTGCPNLTNKAAVFLSESKTLLEVNFTLCYQISDATLRALKLRKPSLKIIKPDGSLL